AVISQNLHFLSQLWIVRHNRSSFAKSSEVFSRVKAKATGVAQSARFSALVFGAVRLRSVLDDEETVSARKFQDRVHVGRLPKKMDRNNGFGSYCERFLQLGRVHRERVFVHIDKDRSRVAKQDGFGRGNKGVWHRDHFVALGDPQGHKRQPERVGAVAHAHGILRAAIRGEFRFELLHEWSAGKGIAGDHFMDSALEFLHQRRVMFLQVEKRDFYWRHVAELKNKRCDPGTLFRL